MAFPSGWTRKAPITIPAGKVAGSAGVLFNFPVLLTEATLPIEMFASDGPSPAQNGGGDIRFTADDAGEVPIPADIRFFVTDPDPANGDANIVVCVPDLDQDSDTRIWVWWNTSTTESQPAATEPLGRNAVYAALVNAGEGAVYANGEFVDRAGNGFDLADSGNTAVQTVAGLNGNAWQFDQTNDDALLNAAAPVVAVPHTITGLIQPNEDNNNRWLAVLDGSALLDSFSQRNQVVGVPSAGSIRAESAGSSGSSIAQAGSVATAGTWRFYGGRFDSLTSRTVFVDGTDANTDTGDIGSQLAFQTLKLGNLRIPGAVIADITIEELRIAAVALSDDWINTEANNLRFAATFASAGTAGSATSGVTGNGAGTLIGPRGDGAAAQRHLGGGVALAPPLRTFIQTRQRNRASVAAMTAATALQALAGVRHLATAETSLSPLAGAAAGTVALPLTGEAAAALASLEAAATGQRSVAGSAHADLSALLASGSGAIDLGPLPAPSRTELAESASRHIEARRTARSIFPGSGNGGAN